MRYAVYSTTAAQPDVYLFSSSYATKEAALERADEVNSWGGKIRAVVLEVAHPDQNIDPYAFHFWKAKEGANV